MKWIFKRKKPRHCVAEFLRGDLRVRVLRVLCDKQARAWLSRWLFGGHSYEYQLEFARRLTGKLYGQFKVICVISHLDMPRIAELSVLADRHLHGLEKPLYARV